MIRWLGIFAAAILAIAIGLFAGFRLGLERQPNETRLAVESFSAIELASVVFRTIHPTPIDDHASFGRREHPGRGHSLWRRDAPSDQRFWYGWKM